MSPWSLIPLMTRSDADFTLRFVVLLAPGCPVHQVDNAAQNLDLDDDEVLAIIEQARTEAAAELE